MINEIDKNRKLKCSHKFSCYFIKVKLKTDIFTHIHPTNFVLEILIIQVFINIL